MSATEELRRLLDERGVEWTYGDGTVSYADNERWFHAWAYSDGAMCVSMGYLTPEQAIAATLCETYTREECEAAFVRGYSLGSLPVGSSPQWDENRQTVDGHMAELGWVRAATLGGGKLTADDVRDLIERHSDASGGNGRDFHNGAYVAIADELNATLGGGECELTLDGTDGNFGCSECLENIPPLANFCPNCGKAVKR